jgi:adhesin transport system outer membrane protein
LLGFRLLIWGLRVIISRPRGLFLSVAVAALLSGALGARAAEPFTVNDAIHQAVHTNPNIGEARANRRATEAELGQSQGVLLPQVRLQATAGPEKLKRFINPAPTTNDEWRRGRDASVVVRQLLFDGFASLNQIWRQAARVDAAAFRVHERTELIALDAVEAYLDVVRYIRLIALAEENLVVHRRIRGNVDARFQGGRAGEGDQQQAIERVSSAEATLHEFRASLDEARAKYRRVVGLEPFNLRFPGRLGGLPGSKDTALAAALKGNPTVKAAEADVEAARYDFRSTAGAFVPNVYLEGRALRGEDSIVYDGLRNEYSAKVVVAWDVFRGGQDAWRRTETAERMIEQTERHARLQRDTFESIDKAWAARTITTDRVAALVREVDAARRVVGAYGKEYELGQRTLIDLLNSQNQLFNANVSLVSSRSVTVFADYQLLAAMGNLLDFIKTAPPPEAEPLTVGAPGFIPMKVPPVIFHDPPNKSEPLKVNPGPLPYAPVTNSKGKAPIDAFAATLRRPDLDDPQAWFSSRMGDVTERDRPRTFLFSTVFLNRN